MKQKNQAGNVTITAKGKGVKAATIRLTVK